MTSATLYLSYGLLILGAQFAYDAPGCKFNEKNTDAFRSYSLDDCCQEDVQKYAGGNKSVQNGFKNKEPRCKAQKNETAVH